LIGSKRTLPEPSKSQTIQPMQGRFCCCAETSEYADAIERLVAHSVGAQSRPDQACASLGSTIQLMAGRWAVHQPKGTSSRDANTTQVSPATGAVPLRQQPDTQGRGTTTSVNSADRFYVVEFSQSL
jgi:hypothetical protein